MDFDADVMVIGAEPVGLTLANELSRHGAKVRIADKADAIREVSKAMILHVRTQEVLDKVGVAERARAARRRIAGPAADRRPARSAPGLRRPSSRLLSAAARHLCRGPRPAVGRGGAVGAPWRRFRVKVGRSPPKTT